MTAAGPINIIIAGVGGQGVYTLTRVLWRLCTNKGLTCRGSTFKGGAQTLGSIHSVLRIFPEQHLHRDIGSTQVLERDLDLMLGLEPWETLRYQPFFGRRTAIFMNTRVVPLLQTRYGMTVQQNPVTIVQSSGLPVVAADYTAIACRHYGTGKMANYVLGEDVIGNGRLPFTKSEFTSAFSSQVGQLSLPVLAESKPLVRSILPLEATVAERNRD